MKEEETKQLLIVSVAITAIAAVIAIALVETSRLDNEAQKLQVEQQIEHDQTRPKKVWERD